MVTKGVASVRSPVCNLQRFDSSITHESFTDAVVNEFRNKYNIGDETGCCIVDETEEAIINTEYIRNGMAELPSWEWSFGQTPEFTYTINRSFTWGDVTATILSKHGIILSCGLGIDKTSLSGSDIELVVNFGRSLENRKYGVPNGATALSGDGPVGDVSVWLMQAMAS
ncbi:hypothetical protein AX17_002131 [Amanita inopinata Kibby_2008]|nr:hypothetical protein AX17_002131 [Amanita inopinata Kibby_2008]